MIISSNKLNILVAPLADAFECPMYTSRLLPSYIYFQKTFTRFKKKSYVGKHLLENNPAIYTYT